MTTTDAGGVATCSVDEGTTDLFSLATTGDSAAYGGDPTHLPAVAYFPTPGDENDVSVQIDPATSSKSPPMTPASAAALDSAAPPMVDTSATGTESGSGGGLLGLAGLLGMVLVGTATLGRRRLLPPASKGNGPGPQRG